MDYSKLTQIVDGAPSQRYKRMEYDDDSIIVYKGNKVVYRGMLDYFDGKDDNWKWNDKDKCYTLGDYKLVCLDL